MRIAVIDGQGGGIGKSIVEALRNKFASTVTIVALGTNVAATAVMLKAGADEGASGENAVVFSAPRCQIIMGPIGIISANSMLGELTPLMAQAIAESPAKKVLIPMNKCNISVAGVKTDSLQDYFEDAVNIVDSIIKM